MAENSPGGSLIQAFLCQFPFIWLLVDQRQAEVVGWLVGGGGLWCTGGSSTIAGGRCGPPPLKLIIPTCHMCKSCCVLLACP